jgi:hypothetical protein
VKWRLRGRFASGDDYPKAEAKAPPGPAKRRHVAGFWTYTFPANVATENWTKVPEDWEALRWRWEYSHVAGAVCQILAMCGLIVAVLARNPGQRLG